MRLIDAIEKEDFAGNASSPMLNLLHGGQQGFMPKLASDTAKGRFDEWINNAAYVSRNLIPIVIKTPKIYDILADATLGKRLRNIHIGLMTYIPLTIDGLKATVSLETSEHRIGASGQNQQEEVTKSNRERSTITYTYNEKLGKPINAFFDFLIRYGIADPDTQSPLITTLPITDNTLVKGELYTPDYYSTTILYIEPDLINKNVVEAYLAVNVYPKSAGEISSKRDIGSAGELKEYSIEFASIVNTSPAVSAYAQSVLDRLTIINSSPDTAPIAVNDDDARLAFENANGFNQESMKNPAVKSAEQRNNSFNK